MRKNSGRPPRATSYSATTYPTIHLDKRVGEGWPRKPSRQVAKRNWTGWLTHREYDLIEYHLRWGCIDIYEIGSSMGMKTVSAERMYYTMQRSGVLTDECPIDHFVVTGTAKKLYRMTDEYILNMELDEC